MSNNDVDVCDCKREKEALWCILRDMDRSDEDLSLEQFFYSLFVIHLGHHVLQQICDLNGCF